MYLYKLDVDPRIPSLGDPGMHRPRWSIPSPGKIRPTVIDKNRTKLRCPIIILPMHGSPDGRGTGRGEMTLEASIVVTPKMQTL